MKKNEDLSSYLWAIGMFSVLFLIMLVFYPMIDSPPSQPVAPSDPQERHAYEILRKNDFEHDESARSAKVIKEMVERDRQIRQGTYRKP